MYNKLFQYFNCIGGIFPTAIPWTCIILVSILQLYRWNLSTFISFVSSHNVSILQLYRWNPFAIFKAFKHTAFQYFNCIGGMWLQGLFGCIINCFNTSTVSVEFSPQQYLGPALSLFQYFNCIGGIYLHL